MPWCEDCAKFWTPSSMRPDGSCPTCGRVLPVVGGDASESGEPSDADGAGALPPPITAKDVKLREMAGEDAKAPWHFKVLLGLLVLYLGWRFFDLFRAVF